MSFTEMNDAQKEDLAVSLAVLLLHDDGEKASCRDRALFWMVAVL